MNAPTEAEVSPTPARRAAGWAPPYYLARMQRSGEWWVCRGPHTGPQYVAGPYADRAAALAECEKRCRVHLGQEAADNLGEGI